MSCDEQCSHIQAIIGSVSITVAVSCCVVYMICNIVGKYLMVRRLNAQVVQVQNAMQAQNAMNATHTDVGDPHPVVVVMSPIHHPFRTAISTPLFVQKGDETVLPLPPLSSRNPNEDTSEDPH